MASPREWLLGARPQTLPVAIGTALAGTAVAAYADAVSALPLLLSVLTLLGVQIGANYSNDYFDGIKGTDDDRVGPQRLVASGAASPRSVLVAAVACFAVAAVAGVLVSLLVSPWLLLVGAVCLVAAWTYTGGPRPYAYAGLGELMMFLFFGPVAVIGIAFVQTERMHGLWPVALATSLGAGVITAAVLLSNNIRDIPTDAETGKRTLAVKVGDAAARRLYVALVTVAVVASIVLAAVATPWALLSLLSLGLLVPAVRAVLSGASGTALVPVLARTSVGLLVWALGLLVGMCLG